MLPYPNYTSRCNSVPACSGEQDRVSGQVIHGLGEPLSRFEDCNRGGPALFPSSFLLPGGLSLDPPIDLAAPKPPGPAHLETRDLAVGRMAVGRLLGKLQVLGYLADRHDVAIHAAPHWAIAHFEKIQENYGTARNNLQT